MRSRALEPSPRSVRRTGPGRDAHRFDRTAPGLTTVGWYRELLLPRIVERACQTAEVEAWRRRATEGLQGVIVEIGFGSGANLDHYPPEVDLIHAVEPVSHALARVPPHPITVRTHLGSAESLPIADRSCDAAVSTFTLCTIPDVELALSEIRRVLRPGGRFRFVEHGHSPDEGVARWQHRLDGLQQRLAGGCHLTRDATSLVLAAGFEIVWTRSAYIRGPRPWTWLTEGEAIAPASSTDQVARGDAKNARSVP